jgi:hypothetical protein
MKKNIKLEKFLRIVTSSAHLAVLCDVHQHTVERWIKANHIPEKYWFKIMDAYPSVTRELLEGIKK